MFVIDLWCDCGYRKDDQVFSSHLDYENKKMSLKCPKCNGLLNRTYTTQESIIKENDGPVSCKPGKYWRNAEANRLKEKRKRLEREREMKK
jgi:hypothetical protein